jgi:hypothetical protein
MDDFDMEPWPFDQPPNVAVITTKRIIWQGYPVLSVWHDDDDEDIDWWQFLDGFDIDDEAGAIVGLGEMVKQDRSLLELADLPAGWVAWRASPGEPWRRKEIPPRKDNDDE